MSVSNRIGREFLGKVLSQNGLCCVPPAMLGTSLSIKLNHTPHSGNVELPHDLSKVAAMYG